MFLLSQNDKSVRKRVQKLKNPPPRQATCGTAKKDVANQKIEVKKLKNTGVFHFSLADFGRARSLFFTVFFEGERHDLSKTGGFGRKMGAPPGKPVTFYECHPDDHAPAPSVRADLLSKCSTYWDLHVGFHELCIIIATRPYKGPKCWMS